MQFLENYLLDFPELTVSLLDPLNYKSL